MKVLFVATVRSHIGQFHMPFIRELKKLGFTVDAAYKDNSADKPGLDLSDIDNVYEVPFSRSPYSFSNVKAYFQIKKENICHWQNFFKRSIFNTPTGVNGCMYRSSFALR